MRPVGGATNSVWSRRKRRNRFFRSWVRRMSQLCMALLSRQRTKPWDSSTSFGVCHRGAKHNDRAAAVNSEEIRFSSPGMVDLFS